jgi:hypothetical protein
MKVEMSTRLDIKHNTTAGELGAFFSSLPPDARVTVTKTKYYDQRDPGETYITVRWTEERNATPDVGVTAWRDR